MASGTSPSTAERSPWSRTFCALGMDASSAAVYGCLGVNRAARTSGVGPYSTTVPPYITATLSASREMTLMSWLMSIVAILYSDFSSASRPTILDWIVASSPVVGSSAMSRDGSDESAIAIMARWHMPPDRPYG